MQELQSVPEGLAGYQHQRLYLCGVPARHLHAVVHAQEAGPPDADRVTIHARLREQKLESGVRVVGPFTPVLVLFRGAQLVEGRTTALPVAAGVEGEHVDTRRRRLSGHRVPGTPIA